MMAKIFEAWHDPENDSVGFSTAENMRQEKETGLLGKNATLLWRIEALTFEEAMSIHYLRMGYGPFKPSGEAAECPECGSNYYPEGSAECWKCESKDA